MLVSLSDMKTYLNLSSSTYDTFLTNELTMLSAAVEGFCARKFLTNEYRQTFYARDFKLLPKKLNLYHYPVISIESIEEDETAIAVADYRLQKPSGIIIHNSSFLNCADELIVEYTAGYTYANIPPMISQAIKTLCKERYDKKISGMDVNLGREVQRMSIVGVISLDFDYSLSYADREVKFGQVLGSQLNMIEPFRSERTMGGSGQLQFVEEI